ncbi:MAG: DUF1552 domain-containing protein [Verrucomicrobiales bacterium]|nr:DUF1552 domain-containing protein [Verrucomicrobiales bacterium]
MMNRRTFLRTSGVSLTVPVLSSLGESTARADQATGDIRRMVAINSPLGIHTPYLFPQTPGKDYEVTPYLEPLQEVREKFTVASGLMHPMVDGGHSAERSFLTGAAHPGQPSFRNSISVDQYAAEQIGHLTRFPFLSLSANNNGISYTRSGVQIPAEKSPSQVFKRLFLEGSEEEKAAQMRKIKDGQSIMDLVLDQTRGLMKKTGREDNETLDQYFTGVREVELRLQSAEEWAKRPKPEVDAEPPSDVKERADFSDQMQLMYDLMFLAIQSDSTRLFTLAGAGGNEVVTLKGVDDGWHNLSHHGKDEEKIHQLSIIEKEEMRLFGDFLKRLDEAKEGEHTLLDQTAILLGSNLGNASSHNNTNLPIVAAGGHFHHGQYLAYGEDHTPPLCNLFVSYLQHLGLEVGEFSSGKGTMTRIDAWA